jgi:hypothetical protein
MDVGTDPRCRQIKGVAYAFVADHLGATLNDEHARDVCGAHLISSSWPKLSRIPSNVKAPVSVATNTAYTTSTTAPTLPYPTREADRILGDVFYHGTSYSLRQLSLEAILLL